MRMGMTSGFHMGRRHKKHNFSIFILILAVGLLMFFVFERMQPVFETEIEYYANRLVTEAVSEAVSDAFENGDYSSFSKIEQNSNEKVTAVEADTAKINSLRFKMDKLLRERLDKGEGETVYIPLGSLSGFYVLNGAGPQIPVKISPVSMISSDFEEGFESVGINHVKHKLYLNVEVEVKYAGFLMCSSKTVKTSIPIIETVIAGDVPQYYGNGTAMAIPE